MSRAHIIEKDPRKRAQIARTMLARNLHAEIYEDLPEFEQSMPQEGFILCALAEADNLLNATKQGCCEMPLIVYSESPTMGDVVDAINSRALDFMEWPFTAESVDRCLRRLATQANHQLAQLKKRAQARTKIGKLTAREVDVLVAVAQGGSNKSIGYALGISPRTVEIHRGNLMGKLEARSVADAVRIALYAGLDEQFDAAA